MRRLLNTLLLGLQSILIIGLIGIAFYTICKLMAILLSSNEEDAEENAETLSTILTSTYVFVVITWGSYVGFSVFNASPESSLLFAKFLFGSILTLIVLLMISTIFVPLIGET